MNSTKHVYISDNCTKFENFKLLHYNLSILNDICSEHPAHTAGEEPQTWLKVGSGKEKMWPKFVEGPSKEKRGKVLIEFMLQQMFAIADEQSHEIFFFFNTIQDVFLNPAHGFYIDYL